MPILAQDSLDAGAALNYVDSTAVAIFLALAIGMPIVGYVCLVLDVRAYLRSLRRALVVVRNHFPHLPTRSKYATPRCLIAFDLTMPCTEERLMQAYRTKVKELHPDRGGDRQRFMLLQRFFEEALDYVRQYGGEGE